MKQGKGEVTVGGYLGSGIGALEECIRVCHDTRHPKINYLIGRAYSLMNMPFKKYEYWLKIGIGLSTRKTKELSKFLDEFEMITRLRSVA